MTFMIKRDKFYRDSRGAKHGPMVVSTGSAWAAGRSHVSDPEWTHDGKAIIGGADLVAEWVDTPAGDGWITWEGGRCPVREMMVGAVRFRDGDAMDPCTFGPGARWDHDGSSGDIVAYRIDGPAATAPASILAAVKAPAKSRDWLQTASKAMMVSESIAADLLAALKECHDAEVARRRDLKPGSPAHGYSDARLARVNAAIAEAEGRGIRPQSFAERECDLLNANNRLLERARKAEADRDSWRATAEANSRMLDEVANRGDEERGMVWLVTRYGRIVHAMEGVLPYAETLSENMKTYDAGAEKFGRPLDKAATAKCVAAVEAAKRLIGRL
ncbi:MAG: hypothetical protein O9972_39740 [Burkholderiales bacterium]|nr:hypothetical protein [Burkholderiales bacterium]